MDTYLQLESKDYEVLECKNGDCYIKDKRSEKYYFKQTFFASRSPIFDRTTEVSFNIADKVYAGVIFLSFIMFAFLLARLDLIFNHKLNLNWQQYTVSLLFLIANVVLHEFGHYTALRIYGRKVSKIGFKMNFIFPAFFVNTSDSYLLPRLRRFYVYYSGIMVNIFLSFAITAFIPQYAYLSRLVFWAIVSNLIPVSVLKTDGYHIIFNVIFKMNNFKNSKSVIFLLTKYAFIVIVIVMIALSLLKLWGIM